MQSDCICARLVYNGPMRFDRRAEDLIDGAGIRLTKSRAQVLSAILAAGRSLSHPELAGLLPELDRVTVFRSLKALKASGLLHGIQGLDGILRYVANPVGRKGCPGRHPHFLCLECGAMSCLSDQKLPHVRVPDGAEVAGKQYLVYGLCPLCGAKSRSKRGQPAVPGIPGRP